jgi:2,4-dienoyl-CoA reductase-like NADH-dependent reductase (Old Yellow Enzyme family)
MTGSHDVSAPLVINGKLRIANRIVKAATAEGLAETGNDPGGDLIGLYRRWARGGAGLLITGNAHIDRRFRERASSLVLDDRSDRDAFRALTTAVHCEGTPILAQLNHPGRQCPAYIAPRPLGPSAERPLFRWSGYGRSQAMTLAQIEQVIAAFARSAGVAAECGFDGVQVHAAHGYLLSAFLSPRHNGRGDAFGGSLANRARLLVEIVAGIRRTAPQTFLIAVKLNVSDFERGGFAPAEALEVARLVEQAGADCLETSGGTYRELVTALRLESAADVRQAGWERADFSDFSARLATQIRIPIILTGNIRSRVAMDRALALQGAAMIGLARPFCVDLTVAARLLDGGIDNLDELPAPIFRSPRWLGPHSPVRRIRRYSAFAEMAWYAEQLRMLAKGEPIDYALSPHAALKQMAARDRQFSNATVP